MTELGQQKYPILLQVLKYGPENIDNLDNIIAFTCSVR